MVSLPEIDSDPPIGSDRESGRDTHALSGCQKNVFHHSPWTLLLQRDAFRLKERKSNLSEVGDENVSTIARKHNGRLYQ